MALVNPQIAMSYRPTTEYQPRNALAEYAQLQSIVGAQRQAEVADMQLQRMRQEDAEIERIHQLAKQYGAPESRLKMGQELFASRNPQQRELGYKIIQHEENKALFERAERNFGYASSSAAGAAPGAGVTPSFRIAGKDVPMGTLGTGTFDSADALDIGVVPPQRPPLSAEDRAAVVASMGPSGLKAGLREHLTELNVGPYTGLNAAQMTAVLRANPDERAALDRALPSMKIPGVSAGQVPAFSQLSRDLLSPETRAAQDFNYAPSLPASAFAPAAPAAAPAANVLAAQQGATPPPSVNQLAAAGGGKSLEQLQREFITYSNLAKLGAPGAEGRLELIKQQIEDARKAYEVGGRLVTREGKILYEAPPPPTELTKTMRDRDALIASLRAKGEDPSKNADVIAYNGKISILTREASSDLTKAMRDRDTLIASLQARGIDPSRNADVIAYNDKIRKLTTHQPAAQQNVYAYTPASETAQAEFMRGVRTTYDALKNAPATLKNIEAAKALVPGAAGFMGAGGEPLLKAASFLNNRFGMSISTQGVTDATELRSRLFAGVIENLRKLDAQPTQAQQQALQDAIGNLGTDPSALPRVLDAMAQSVRDKVELYNKDVTSAEQRGVRFPYKPQIELPPVTSAPGAAAAQIPAGAAAPTAGVIVRLPNGTDMTFPNAEAAANFKRKAGLP